MCTGKNARLAPHVFVAVPAPTLDLDPSSATAGSTVQVRGSNWQVGGGDVSVFADPSLRFDPSAALLTIRPNVDGTFASSLVLPSLGTGVHELFACQSCADAGYLRASRSFTITASAHTVPPLLVGLAAATVATAGLAFWRIRRIRRPKPPVPREPQQAAPPPPGPPQFRLRADDNLGVGVRSPDGPRRPTVRLIPRPDVSPDAERVEVLT